MCRYSSVLERVLCYRCLYSVLEQSAPQATRVGYSVCRGSSSARIVEQDEKIDGLGREAKSVVLMYIIFVMYQLHDFAFKRLRLAHSDVHNAGTTMLKYFSPINRYVR